MQYLLSAEQMRRADKNTIEIFKVPSLVLMERAALRVIEMIEKEELDCTRTLIVCGTGNNGGDGMAVARMLYLSGKSVAVWLVGSYEKCSDETKRQYDILRAYEIEVTEKIEPENVNAYTLVIDALFGIGLSRDIGGIQKKAVELMNRMEAAKVALDIPSGIHADSGAVMGTCVYADDTVTFAYHKTGLCLYPGAEAAGKLHVMPIGITEESFLQEVPQTLALEKTDLSLLPKRKADSNKGTYGKVLVIAGSEEMAGAAYFSAKAAYLTGCGLVKVFTHEKNRTMLNTRLPEAILATYDEKENYEDVLKESISRADAVVIGPGLGTSDTAEKILKTVLETAEVPLVADADALNLLARKPELLKNPHTDIIVTPHLGEMSRLTNLPIAELKKNLLVTAREFAQTYNVICVQKDARTITSIPNGKTYINLSGNHGMATAGSGDVLTGIIAGLLAAGMEAESAAPLGVYIHGLSGDVMAEKTGCYSLMADDILDGIKEVVR